MEKNICEVLASTTFNSMEVIEVNAVQTLEEIRKILKNDTFSDFECIEKIVMVLESKGIDAGNRHDFG